MDLGPVWKGPVGRRASSVNRRPGAQCCKVAVWRPRASPRTVGVLAQIAVGPEWDVRCEMCSVLRLVVIQGGETSHEIGECDRDRDGHKESGRQERSNSKKEGKSRAQLPLPQPLRAVAGVQMGLQPVGWVPRYLGKYLGRL